MKCPVCQSQTTAAFKAQVLLKYDAEYFVCDHCGYLFAKEPYWLDEAYTSAIASTDTGLVKRNISISGKVASLLYLGMNERGNGRYLDVAGGYGMFTRLMRDFGFDFFWQDKYCSNLLSQGFEHSKSYEPYDAVTAFEVLEHVTDPVEFIKNTMLDVNSDTLIFSTVLYSGAPPDPNEWWYYSFQAGQHIGFFQRKTLEIIANKLNLNFYSENKIHIFSRKKISTILLKISVNNIFSRIFPYLIQFNLGTLTESDQEKILKSPNLM